MAFTAVLQFMNTGGASIPNNPVTATLATQNSILNWINNTTNVQLSIDNTVASVIGVLNGNVPRQIPMANLATVLGPLNQSVTITPPNGSTVPLTIIEPVVSPSVNTVEWWGYATTQSARQAYVKLGWSNAVFAQRLPTWSLGLDTYVGTIPNAIQVGVQSYYTGGASVGINGPFDQSGYAFNLTVYGSQGNNDQLLLLPYGTTYNTSLAYIAMWVDDVNNYGSNITCWDNNTSPQGLTISAAGTYRPPLSFTAAGVISLNSYNSDITLTANSGKVVAGNYTYNSTGSTTIISSGLAILAYGYQAYNYTPTYNPGFVVRYSGTTLAPVLQLLTDVGNNHLELLSGISGTPVRLGILSGAMYGSYSPSSYFGQMSFAVDSYLGTPQTAITLTAQLSGTPTIAFSGAVSFSSLLTINNGAIFTPVNSYTLSSLTPLIINGATTPVAYPITNKSLTSNVATLTTSYNTGSITVGHNVTVTGVDATFNGTYQITAVTGTTFSYAKTAGNVTSQACSGSAVVDTQIAPLMLINDGSGLNLITVSNSGLSVTGKTTVTGNGNYIKLPLMTVAYLTAAGTAGVGSIACVSDATSTTAGTTVVGGGSNSVYVRSNGTNWIIF